MKKRISLYVLLLCLTIICTGIMPVHAEENVKESSLKNEALIDSVSVEITAPIAGDTPDYHPVLPAGAPYYSDSHNVGAFRNDVAWKKAKGSILSPDNDVFEYGVIYEATIYLTPEDGYAFAENPSVTVNGKRVTTHAVRDGQLQIDCKFPAAPARLDAVFLRIASPAIGARPEYSVDTPSGALYYLDDYSSGMIRNDICWAKASGSNLNPDTAIFEAGTA